jgi:hypothetical protein
MCIRVTVDMRCSIVILFTCVLVLSHPVVRGGCTCETEIVGTKSQILGGPKQTRRYMWKRAENKAMKDVFARCLKKITAQVCTKYMIT